MDSRTLGLHGPAVSSLGLGCMGMSDLYGPANDQESRSTIQAALEHGITLFDTGDFYGAGHNEMLLREALQGRKRDNVVLSVKFGALRDPSGGWTGIDARPAAIKNFLAYTLRRLGTDYVDIYRPGRIDPQVPIEDVVGTLADMVKAGFVRYVGLSEVGAGTLRRAHAVHPIADLQIEYSLISRGIEAAILPTARSLGVGITAYGVLSRGLISGHWTPNRQIQREFRGFLPRFSNDNLPRNLAIVDRISSVAKSKGASVAQMAIAWVLSRGQDIVPLVGARTRDQLSETLGAMDITLTQGDLAALEAAVPPEGAAGTRYDAHQMRILDSEREGGS